jgi:hypothetical protein
MSLVERSWRRLWLPLPPGMFPLWSFDLCHISCYWPRWYDYQLLFLLLSLDMSSKSLVGPVPYYYLKLLLLTLTRSAGNMSNRWPGNISFATHVADATFLKTPVTTSWHLPSCPHSDRLTLCHIFELCHWPRYDYQLALFPLLLLDMSAKQIFSTMFSIATPSSG